MLPPRRRHLARQDVSGLLADHRVSLVGNEADDQADFFLLSRGIAEGEPETVGMAQVRLAVVLCELFPGKDELSVGLDFFHLGVVFLKGVDLEPAIDLDGFGFAAIVEHQPAAKTPQRRLVRPQLDRVDPDRRNAARLGGFLLSLPRPGKRLIEVE